MTNAPLDEMGDHGQSEVPHGYVRVPGYRVVDVDAVPGIGPILRLEHTLHGIIAVRHAGIWPDAKLEAWIMRTGKAQWERLPDEAAA